MTATTIAATRALSDLVDSARAQAERAARLDHPAARLRHIVRTLDSARTRLVQEGIDYLDTAWAFVDAGRVQLARAKVALDAVEQSQR